MHALIPLCVLQSNHSRDSLDYAIIINKACMASCLQESYGCLLTESEVSIEPTESHTQRHDFEKDDKISRLTEELQRCRGALGKCKVHTCRYFINGILSHNYVGGK